MSVTADTLRELHRLHQQLSDLRDRVDRGPRQVKARDATVIKLEQTLAQVQADSKAARIAADQKQLQLKSDEAKIHDLTIKQNQAKSNKEYQLLKEQIAASEMANSVLADEILDALEKCDQLEASIAEAKQNLVKGREDLEGSKQTVQARQEGLIGEVHRLEVDLKAAEERLPADVRADYDRIIRSKGSEGMAQVEGEFCTGCHRQITPNMYNSLRLSHVIFCKSCGRLLYLPEDRTVAGH